MKKLNKKVILLLDVWLFIIVAFTTKGLGVILALLSSLFHCILLIKEANNDKRKEEKKKKTKSLNNLGLIYTYISFSRVFFYDLNKVLSDSDLDNNYKVIAIRNMYNEFEKECLNKI